VPEKSDRAVLPLIEHITRPVVVAGILIGLMATIDTLALSIRVSAVLTKRLAVALSLFNIVMLVARLSNVIQAPIVGTLGDAAANTYNPEWLAPKIRIIIVFTTLGTVAGAFLTPTFVQFYAHLIRVFEEKRTVPATLFALLSPARLRVLPSLCRAPRFSTYFFFVRQIWRVPVDLLVFQMFVTGFYTIGVLSTVYAAALVPDLRLTVSNLSGIVNGIATLLLFVLVDPPAAMVVDHCISGKRPESDAKVLNVLLVTMRLAGTLMAQLLLVPMAHWVAWVAEYIQKLMH
jgi:hypothetical protein